MDVLQQITHHLWQPTAWLRVTGDDALEYLQGQSTAEVRNLMAKEATYGLWLNQKGKVVADSFVIRGEKGEFFLCSYQATAAVIRERLEAYIIADDVTLTDETDAWQGLTLFTDAPVEAWRETLPGGFVFRGRRDATTHWEWVAPRSIVDEVRDQLASKGELNALAMERRRIEAGIPAIPADIGPEDLPNEAGLDASAISYTKGCYLGQEVMARLKAMGQVRRRLLRVTGRGEAPSLPAALFVGERQVGELRSAVPTETGFAGLAMITLLHLPTDGMLALALNGPMDVVVHDQP